MSKTNTFSKVADYALPGHYDSIDADERERQSQNLMEFVSLKNMEKATKFASEQAKEKLASITMANNERYLKNKDKQKQISSQNRSSITSLKKKHILIDKQVQNNSLSIIEKVNVKRETNLLRKQDQ